MNWPTPLPAAALRVTRTAVGRRALQLALLVGGLFALGLLCGGQAQAAEGVPGQQPGIPVVASVVKSLPVPVQVPVRAPAQVPVLAPVLAPVSDTVERVVRPVSDVVEKTVTEVLTKAPTTLPSLPSAPTQPVQPTQPSQPGLPVQTSPAHTMPAAHTAPAPTPKADSAPAPADVTVDASHASYGPHLVADVAVAVPHHPDAHRARSGPAPTHQAPNGDLDGALRNQSAVDNGTSRHCDAHAVTSENPVPVRFVPGVAARVDAAETRDRYRDIPVFPG
ncbi:hypothetical protein ABZT04_05275 [Streptomyces sp. NPDC005492]|uniref:hypothetical protein n=1 Tax=Streptomyces sp. NPDC005492 TaxID=3156883 RepID=UPI0033AFF6FE